MDTARVQELFDRGSDPGRRCASEPLTLQPFNLVATGARAPV